MVMEKTTTKIASDGREKKKKGREDGRERRMKMVVMQMSEG
ncbi:hypothetical protein BVRB_2g039460 [Beta vulgaris subsp. vulgaris]|nr:hypothetical protein BVRB_2g039460 [Beta vulgaris subsp. vulgaris]